MSSAKTRPAAPAGSSARPVAPANARTSTSSAAPPPPSARASAPTGTQPGTRTKHARAHRDGVGRRTSSVARSIALSIWAERLATFLLIDLGLCLALVGTFAWQCVEQIPEEARSGSWPGLTLNSATLSWDSGGQGLWDDAVRVVDNAGVEHVFPLSDLWEHALPIAVVTLTIETVSLLSVLGEPRKIRRKLRPLNELALAADAIGSAVDAPAIDARGGVVGGSAAGATGAAGAAGEGAGSTARRASTDALSQLEHAIETASVDAPQVTTGDKDLQSIEVALNSLLRRMQQAKLQQMRFVSDASHELRTPIAVIRGYVDMLDRWGKSDEAVLDESIDALKAETAHMQELVEQLLFLARGDSGRQTLECAPFDLAALVEEVAEESQMIDADHPYVVRPLEGARAQEPLPMVGDRAMVKQSIRVIVQNAARYSPAGSPIELGVRREAGTGRVAYLVEDRGMGMAQADVAHVFERFYRADAARGEHKEGTGLGLAIAKWIVDAHDGQIDVVSREGLGTRFTVWFPAGAA